MIFFIYGGRNVYLYAQLVGGSLLFTYRQDEITNTVTMAADVVNICDGLWKTINFAKVSPEESEKGACITTPV